MVVQENISIETFEQRLDEETVRYAPPASYNAPAPPAPALAPVLVPTPPATPTSNTGPSLISNGSRWKSFCWKLIKTSARRQELEGRSRM